MTLKYSERVLRVGDGKRCAHDCKRKSLTDAEDLAWTDVGSIVACPECGRRWKVVAAWMIGGGRQPLWRRRWLPWPREQSEEVA